MEALVGNAVDGTADIGHSDTVDIDAMKVLPKMPHHVCTTSTTTLHMTLHYAQFTPQHIRLTSTPTLHLTKALGQ